MWNFLHTAFCKAEKKYKIVLKLPQSEKKLEQTGKDTQWGFSPINLSPAWAAHFFPLRRVFWALCNPPHHPKKYPFRRHQLISLHFSWSALWSQLRSTAAKILASHWIKSVFFHHEREEYLNLTGPQKLLLLFFFKLLLLLWQTHSTSTSRENPSKHPLSLTDIWIYWPSQHNKWLKNVF